MDFLARTSDVNGRDRVAATTLRGCLPLEKKGVFFPRHSATPDYGLCMVLQFNPLHVYPHDPTDKCVAVCGKSLMSPVMEPMTLLFL